MKVMERVRSGFNDVGGLLTLSVGYSVFPCPAGSKEDLIVQADRALYYAKSMGRDRIDYYIDVYDDIEKVFNTDEQFVEDLKSLLLDVSLKDRYTFAHSERVSNYAVLIGKSIGMKEEELKFLRIAALLHDIGKIEIPDEILNKQGRLDFKCITPFVPFTVDDYIITPLKADHDPKTNPVFYIISDKKKNILYANDTGYFPDETWDYLKEHKQSFDFVSLDCTIGIREARTNHMSLETVTEVKERLIEMSCAGSSTVFCLHHFSHNGTAIYDELVPIAENYGFLVAYDGMKLEI
jgi:hypothetical protein